jgi:hypothetical protein
MPGYGTLPADRGSGLLPWSAMLAAENAKYGTDFGLDMVDPASSNVFALAPDWVFAPDSNDFTGSPTRFTFERPTPDDEPGPDQAG